MNQRFTNAKDVISLISKSPEYPAYGDYGDRLSSEFLENVPSPGNLGPFGNILVTALEHLSLPSGDLPLIDKIHIN